MCIRDRHWWVFGNLDDRLLATMVHWTRSSQSTAALFFLSAPICPITKEQECIWHRVGVSLHANGWSLHNVQNSTGRSLFNPDATTHCYKLYTLIFRMLTRMGGKGQGLRRCLIRVGHSRRWRGKGDGSWRLIFTSRKCHCQKYENFNWHNSEQMHSVNGYKNHTNCAVHINSTEHRHKYYLTSSMHRITRQYWE